MIFDSPCSVSKEIGQGFFIQKITWVYCQIYNKKIAKINEIGYNKIEQQTAQNTINLFNLA